MLAVLGGLILIFALPESSDVEQARDLIHHVGQVVNEGLGGWEWDGVRLAVGVGESDADEWDELCAEAGLEFVQLGGRQVTLNEFGGMLSFYCMSAVEGQIANVEQRKRAFLASRRPSNQMTGHRNRLTQTTSIPCLTTKRSIWILKI